MAHATGIGFVDPPGLKMRTIRTLERGIALLRFSNVSVDPLLTRFEVARFGAEVVRLRRNTGIYHNPKRQRGIYVNTAQNAKTQSLAHAAGWDRRKCATSKLTLRVTMKQHAANTE